MARGLAKPIRFDATHKIPPLDSVAHSVTPDGRQLFQRKVARSRPVPLLDDKGDRIWAKNPLNGEPLYPKNKPEFYTDDHLFYLEDEGNGNVHMIRYTLPTEKEIAEEARRKKIKEMGGKLAEALVDLGIDSVDELAKRLSGTMAAPQASTSTPSTSQTAKQVEPVSESGKEVQEVAEIVLGVPEHTGAGWWKLSDGNKIRGSKETAEEKEQEIYEAKLNARSAPEI